MWESADGTGTVSVSSYKVSLKKYLEIENTNTAGFAKFEGDLLFYRFYGGESYFIGKIIKMKKAKGKRSVFTHNIEEI